MTEQLTPRIIAQFDDYESMLSGLRIRLAELNIVGTALDEIMCLPDGYTSKVLGPKPVRGLTMFTLGSFLGALGVRCVLVEIPGAAERLLRNSKVKVRNPNLVRDATRIVFTNRELRKMGIAGGKACAANRTPAKRSKAARKAAKARWHKPRRALVAAQPQV